MTNYNIPYGFTQVDEFTPAYQNWQTIGNVTWTYQESEKAFLLTATKDSNIVIKIYILGPSAFRVRFNPNSPNYPSKKSSAVVNLNLGTTQINYREDNNTLIIDLDHITINIGLQPYGIAVTRKTKENQVQTIHETNYDYNLVYEDNSEVTACFMKVPSGVGYYGFGEKAGIDLNQNFHTMTFFNYDNFTYEGPDTAQDNNYPVVPSGPGPLNVEEPLYNSMPILVEWNPKPSGDFAGDPYAYAIFLDNPCQTYFNIQTNDYSQYMDGKYYFGSLYNEMDYYFMAGNDIPSVLTQYTILTGPAPMPPMYALGYQQGCYGYYDEKRVMDAAQAYRNNQIPIDGLHIDVDFQDEYRTFTSSSEKFPYVQDFFNTLHEMGFKCSTNITGIMSIVHQGSPPYTVQALDENGQVVTRNILDDGTAKNMFIMDQYIDEYAGEGSSANPFIINENYGTNTDGFNTYIPPNTALGTYGYYADMLRDEVKVWWSGNYYELIDKGLDMIWQDMTCPAVTASIDAKYLHYKTLPGNLLMSNLEGNQVPNAKIHNAYALNMIQATYEGLTRIKNSLPDNSYNKNKRNFIIARGGYAGVHRYAANWTGDSASSWEFLSINISEVLNWGISGQPLSGCDIGGFANGSGSAGSAVVHNGGSTDPNNPPYITGGQTEPNLLARWMTMGAFLPWYRNHYDGYTKAYQEPYNYSQYPHENNTYDTRVLPACKKYIEIRYQLLQLFYDAMYECTQTGMPICRAMFLNDPQDQNLYPPTDVHDVLVTPYNSSQQYQYDTTPTYRDRDQFFVGHDLLVAPVILERWESSSYSPGSQNNYPSRPVYLPAGFKWYAFTGDFSGQPDPYNNLPTTLQGTIVSTASGTYTWNTSQLDLVPAYIREGAIIPVRHLEQYVGQLAKNYLTYNIYPGQDSSYLCYQDDHITMDAENSQAYRTTQIQHKQQGSGQEITLTRLHDNYTPPEEFYYVALLGQTQAPSSVAANDSTLQAVNTLQSLADSSINAYFYSLDRQTIFIKVFDKESSMTLLVSGLKPIS